MSDSTACPYVPPSKRDSSGNCVPCESLDPSSLMSTPNLEAAVNSECPLWKIKFDSGFNRLSREYTAKNFLTAMKSLNDIGEICESRSHHADLHLTSYRNVEIVVYTHSVKGVTRNDVELCKKLDEEVKVGYSPKWLKEHPEAVGTEAPKAPPKESSA
ncbi:hypothetical protein TL16_g12127 [Triparma laevis f. inornata]|uniref:4a-hydroxytetrahydrobiopterin dehydratase n=2 Tax=Triparma laevis TaxID=1534972 RepID=A0A9W7KWR5_9STRA|nr:hypothetical protein TL16_g12127 [Triparma laevis f. inornata]GMI14582.1 hypothetical protein TrLO_g4422 [Triparma laevis f. longispina]